MRKLVIYLILSISAISLFSQQPNRNQTSTEIFDKKLSETVSDIDGNTHRTIKIGNQVWMAEQRTKEIGIRKVMGATVSTITLSLSKNFTSWVLISNLFAWPIGYYLMTRWLEDFAYKVRMEWWMFGFAALLSTVIALLTICYQSIRAATRNPVDSLRYE